MKGLNLYDNPFTMDAQYAEDLTNFMPPTTELKVRPGIQSLSSFYGAVKGLYSYSVGRTVDFGESWFDQTVTDGEYQALILKLSENSGNTTIYGYNTSTFSNDVLNTTEDNAYTTDYIVFKHSLFLCTADPSLPMYIWSARLGWKKMQWKLANSTYLTDVENVCYYNGYIYINVRGTFDIYCQDITKVNPSDPSLWDGLFTWFSPTCEATSGLTLDGVAQKGGKIMKMMMMSRSGIETVNAYLVVITNMGEVILWQSQMPEGSTKPQHQLVGRFEIPAPLNKDCFCRVEGDLIVATQNGLFSLNRVCFGQQTEITNSIETRILNVFDNYMFKTSEYQKFFGLYYNMTNRLMIFNVPTQMPVALSSLGDGFELQQDGYFTFPTNYKHSVKANEDNAAVAALKRFIGRYLYYNWLNYTVFIQFENSLYEGIILDFETVLLNSQEDNSAQTSISFYSRIYSDKKSKYIEQKFFEDDLVFKCPDFAVANPQLTLQDDLAWNEALKKDYNGYEYFAYALTSVGLRDKKTVTKIGATSSIFAYTLDYIPLLSTFNSEEFKGATSVQIAPLINTKNTPNFPKNLAQTLYLFGQSTGSQGDYPDGWIMGGNGNLTADEYRNKTLSGLIPTGAVLPPREMLACLSYVGPHQPDTYEWFVKSEDIGKYMQYNIDYVFKVDGITYTLSSQTNCQCLDIGRRNYIGYDRYMNGALFQAQIYNVLIRDDNGNVSTIVLPINVTLKDGFYGQGIGFLSRLVILPTPATPGLPLIVDRDLNMVPYRDYSDLTIYKQLLVGDIKNMEFISFTGKLTHNIPTDRMQWLIDRVKTALPDFSVGSDGVGFLDAQGKYGWLMSAINFTVADVPIPPDPPPPPPPPPPAPNIYARYNLLNLKMGDSTPTPDVTVKYSCVADSMDAKLSFCSEELDGENPYAFIKQMVTTLFNELSVGKIKFSRFMEIINPNLNKVEQPYYKLFPREVLAAAVKMIDSAGKSDWSKDIIQYKIRQTITSGESQMNFIEVIYHIEWGLNSQERKMPIVIWADINSNYGKVINSYAPDGSTLERAFLYYLTIIFPKDTPIDDWDVELEAQYLSLCSKTTTLNENVQYFNPAVWTVATETANYQAISMSEYKSAIGFPEGNLNQDPVSQYEPYLWIGMAHQTCYLTDKLSTAPRIKPQALLAAQKKFPVQSLISAQTSEKIKALRLSRGDGPPPTTAILNSNVDFKSVPLLSGINYVCDYKSEQYVMNSYYGTWSKWSGVNMIMGITHYNDFYFIRPKDIPEDSVGANFIYNTSELCRFNPNQFGDDPMDMYAATSPIHVSYQPASSNLGLNQRKLMQRVKVLATQSTFWGQNSNNMAITILSDFFENPAYYYQHTDNTTGAQYIMNKMVKEGHLRYAKPFKDFSYKEMKKFYELYASESSQIVGQDIALLCRPANRIGIRVNMDIQEANIIIYGYEITLKLLQTLL
jgi:hypothetical protein